MGLLDDAIREHLELKRRHGASPEDVERQEREALGAARREAPPAPAAEEAAEEPPAAGPFDAEEAPSQPGEGPAEAPEAVEPAPLDAEPEATRVHDEVPPAEPEVPEPGREAGAPGYDEDPWLEEERDEVPADETLDRQAPEAEQGEDVLEETPDFLQETPEHERLWFEQRPPRDFDWDK